MVTLAEGEINELHVGLKGTMNALFLTDLANKTRRGLRGRVEAGRSGGGLTYGYDVVKTPRPDGTAETGAPHQRCRSEDFPQDLLRIRGGSVAAVHRAGTEPGWYCRSARPGLGRFDHQWQCRKGDGILDNQAYVGKLVWNKLRYVKDPETRKRRAKANKAEAVIEKDVPHLRIVDQDLWDAVKRRQAEQHATRAEAFPLSAAILAFGHPHLAIVPLVCFEWLQRPENILAGHLRWTDYRPLERPNHVRIVHHKTGEVVWHPLESGHERFYAELEQRLSELDRLAIPIVVSRGDRGARRLYSFSYAKRIAREARRAAGLPEHVTMTACRHGGMTELGDAELTEQGVMSLSGHRSPEAARGYVKKTDAQRLAAARKRRAWVIEVEHARNESQNGHRNSESEWRR
jgi:Recombinase